MYVGNRVSQCFIEGLETFLDTATEYKKPENMSDVHYICCPCIDHCNEKKIGNSHSTWSVTLCIYNLTSWLCMKRKFIIISLLINGAV
jgi:hypothetical protein